MNDNEILGMWAHRAGFPSPLGPGDAARGWWNPETALAVRRVADSTWHVDCFPARVDPGVVASEEGAVYSVRWNGRSAAIAAKRQAIRYSHVVEEPLSRISARLMG